MRWMTARTICLSISLLVLLPASCRKEPKPPTATIRGRTWRVELATTSQQRRRGLSAREYLADDEGMLFVHPTPRVLKYWMDGCAIPLDVAFIDADARIVAIHTMAFEDGRIGRTRYSSSVEVRYALEVAGGALERAGVRVGDRVFQGGQRADLKLGGETGSAVVGE